jgi:peptidoglycan/LPS O-acetylase OafA/YrhL
VQHQLGLQVIIISYGLNLMPANNFTLIRLLLATLVIFGHFKLLAGLPSTNGIYDYADFAVDAFFIVSGYLVYSSFDTSPKTGRQRIGNFYIRRFFKIYPLYLVVILAQMLFMFFLFGDKVQLLNAVKYLGSNLIFANFMSPDIGGLFSKLNNNAINPSLWTLKIEAMFYLLVPFLWWFIERKGIIALSLIYILSTAFFIITTHYGAEALSKQLPSQLRFFIVGIALYYYHDKLNIPASLSFTISVMLFIICSFRNILPIMPIYPLLVGALIFICALRLPVIELKYDISYGTYLIHAPLIQIALLLGFYKDNILFLLSLITTVYVIAFIAEKNIEIPMVNYGKKISKHFSKRFEQP